MVIHPQDCVATAITALKAGETATMFIGEREISVVLHQDVPFGHKFAICDVPFHGEVYKYGESIGRATQEIKVATMCTSTMWKANADVVTGNNIKQGKMIMSNETFWFPPP